MQEVISTFYRLFCLVLSIYGVYFGVVSLCFLLKKRRVPPPVKQLRFAVLIAARNEESCIDGIVESILHQNYPQDLVDVYVIPNNCTDNTAQVARAAGAAILSVPPSVSSKGQALHEAFSQLLSTKSHDAFCVFDADNEAHPDFLSEMNCTLNRTRAAKSRILAKNAHESWVCACYETYFCNANLFLNTARHKLGLPARLIGTGFAVRRDLMEDLGGWNTATLTEGAEFYAMLATRGERIAFVPGAITYDEEPMTFRDSVIQRRRWMSGVMGVGIHKAGAFLSGAIKGPKRLFALDALMQFSFSCIQALTLPLFLLWACVEPAAALDALPELVIKFYLSTFFIGGISLLLERRLTRHTAFALFLYPLFIFSFLPLQTVSLFRPNRRWTPIRHTGVRMYRTEVSRG